MNYTVVTSDKHEIEITEEMANFSNIWKMMTDDDLDHGDEEKIIFPTPIRKELIDKVLDFINLCLQEPVGEISKPLSSGDFESNSGVPSWAEDWLKTMDKKELQAMIMCANFLDIQPLLHLCSAYVAFQIKGKTPDEIKEAWAGIPVNPNLS